MTFDDRPWPKTVSPQLVLALLNKARIDLACVRGGSDPESQAHADALRVRLRADIARLESLLVGAA